MAPIDLLTQPARSVPTEVEPFVQHLRSVGTAAKTALLKAQAQAKRAYDRRHLDAPRYAVGDEVLLDTRALTAHRTTSAQRPSKLQMPFAGPFTVLEVGERDNYKLALPPTWRIQWCMCPA